MSQPDYLKKIESSSKKAEDRTNANQTKDRQDDDSWTTEELVGDTEHEDSDAYLIDFRQQIRKFVEDEIENGYQHKAQPHKFYPSSAGLCRRQLFLKKAGVTEPSLSMKGRFLIGSIIHENLEDFLLDNLIYGENVDAELEKSFRFEEDGLTFSGRADVVNHTTDRVVDLKTRRSWHNYNPPFMKHVDQLMAYMKGLDKSKAGLAYIRVKDFETREWPKGVGAERSIEFNPDRWEEIKSKCQDVKTALEQRIDDRDDDELIVEGHDDVPFEYCGSCDACRNEEEGKVKDFSYEFDLTVGDVK